MPLGSLAQQSRMRMWNTEGGGAGGTGSESQGGESDSGNTGETKTYTQADIDNINKALEDERKLRRDAEKVSKDNAKRLKDLEDASKPELERITNERDELKSNYEKALADLRDANARGIVAAAARDAKARSTNAVHALIAKDLEFDESGNPTNVAALIAAVQKSDPDLFGEVVQGKGDGGEGSSAASGDDMNSLIRAAAGVK